MYFGSHVYKQFIQLWSFAGVSILLDNLKLEEAHILFSVCHCCCFFWLNLHILWFYPHGLDSTTQMLLLLELLKILDSDLLIVLLGWLDTENSKTYWINCGLFWNLNTAWFWSVWSLLHSMMSCFVLQLGLYSRRQCLWGGIQLLILSSLYFLGTDFLLTFSDKIAVKKVSLNAKVHVKCRVLKPSIKGKRHKDWGKGYLNHYCNKM